MTSDVGLAYSSPEPSDPSGAADAATAEAPRRPRVWFPVVLVCVYWAVVAVTSFTDTPTFYRFISQALVLLGVLLLFLIWWLFNRRVVWSDRLIVLACAIAAPVLGRFLADKTLGPITVFNGLPVMITAWVAWMAVARNASRPVWRNGLIVVLFLSLASFQLFRMEGLKGEGQPDLRWRWSTRAEDRYLAGAGGARGGAPVTQSTTQASAAPLVLRPGDWPGFRGPRRDGVVRGVSVATDWEKSPPKLLWRTRVGPGWSSVAVVDGRLFTQAQRGENEAVVCRDAASGSELWAHEEPGRFWEALSSVGPRATPTFDEGRIYAQGAAGILVCLDAATGQKVWSRDVLKDADARLPDWGVASSPLVTGGNVIVFAAGQSKKGLLGYRAGTGELAWSADAGAISYSSPHPATIAGKPGIDGISDAGNSAHQVQILASGDRVYMVIYVGPKGQENSADATRFRNSFKLVK